MSEQQPQSFWAIVELMGHQRMAGLVTECTFAGAGMLRVDVPEGEGGAAFTCMISPSAVYAINPVSEAVARAMAQRYRPQPLNEWEIPVALRLPAGVQVAACPGDDDLGDPDDLEHPDQDE